MSGQQKESQKKTPQVPQTPQDPFNATILEIHSGDSFTCVDQKSKLSPVRYFLSSFRAPNPPNRSEHGKPLGLQAKDYLRKRLIGKTVSVHPEYTRISNDKPMHFASVFLDDQNIALEMTELGLGQVVLGQDKSAFIQELLEKQDISKEKGLGIWKEGQNVVRVIDLTGENSGKAKGIWSFMQKSNKMNAIVEVVMNGQRIKVRLVDTNEMVMMQLNGVKVFQNDPNIQIHLKYSQLALEFTKNNLLQRDVQVQFDDCDKNGTFHGTLWLNKKNFAINLLELGLAYCNTQGKASQFQLEYKQIEQKAKESKKGIWSEQEIEITRKEEVNHQTMDETHVVMCTEVVDAQEFYLQGVTNKQLKSIEDALLKFKGTQAENLQFPAKKGTPCIARFDEGWYRAKIIGVPREDQCQVFFVDFGNSDTVDLDNIKKMPQDLINIPNQARKCRFAYLKTPSNEHPMGNVIISNQSFYEMVADKIMEQKMKCQFVYKNMETYYVLLHLEDNTCVNEILLQKGHAKLDKSVQLPSKFESWKIIEDTASEEKYGMWKYDDEDDY